jgi:hypothetical protein
MSIIAQVLSSLPMPSTRSGQVVSLQHGLVSTGERHRTTQIGRVMRASRTPCCACLWTNTSPFALVRSGPLRRRCIVRRRKFLCVTARNDAYVHVRWPSFHPCLSSRRTALTCSGGPQALAYDVQGTLARDCINSLWPYSYCWHRIILYKLHAESCSSWTDGGRLRTP